MKILGWLLLAALSVGLRSQQIAEIQLGRPQAVGPQPYIPDVVPEGCQHPRYKDRQTVVIHRNSKLKIELALPGKKEVDRSEKVEATIVLKNVGKDAVVIPWSSNPDVSKRPTGKLLHEYEQAWFDAELMGSNKISLPLETESVSMNLYSSPVVPGSTLTLQPGQWIVAKASFVIAANYKSSAGMPIEMGRAEIKVEWRQVRYTWRSSGCTVKTEYFNYGYKEDQNAVEVNILR
jgi:hypothetical protein